MKKKLSAHLEDKFANVSGAEHRGVCIFGCKDRKLTLSHGVECLRSVEEELDILLGIEL